MKDKILEILDDRLEAYADQEQGFVREKSVMLAAEELTQLMCDTVLAHHHKVADVMLGRSQKLTLEIFEELGFTEDQFRISKEKLEK